MLLRCLDEGLTGALEAESPAVGPVAAYVMMGEIVAARAPDDDEIVLSLLTNGGHLGADLARGMRSELEAGASLAVILQDLVPESIVAHALAERFRENLAQFLAAVEEPTFLEMEAVFVENIQVGHESRVLVAELEAERALLAPLAADLTRTVWPGIATVTSEEQSRFVELCSPRISVRELLVRSPYERSRTLDVVRRMLDAGLLDSDRGPARRPRAARAEPAVRRGSEWAPDPTEIGGAPLADDHTEEVARPVEPERRSAIPRSAASMTEAARPVQPPVRRAPPPPVDSILDEELAAFGDYDHDRGDGSFVAERENLDRVELGGVPSSDEEVVIEAPEADAATVQSAVQIQFAPPRLSDEEALQKIAVVGDVLATVVAALDEWHGHGVGQARVQVLLEGTSGPFASIFTHVEISSAGGLPGDRILRNVRRRPAGEQRNLLNAALGDVVERSLSLASASLGDQDLERMLEKIAGFQARIGL